MPANKTNLMVRAAPIALALATLFALAAPPQAAAVDKRDLLGSYRDWDAFLTRKEDGSRECYMISKAKSKSPANVDHGDVYIAVSQFPALKRRDEVNLVAGFSFGKNTEVRIGLGGGTYRMFIEGSGAWLRTPREDQQLVAAMKRGSSLTAHGTSARGTNVSYSFSLSGFTAAYNAISGACK